ncbi:MAG: hypothetical protein GKR90_11155 [Pseudomonadales bacterium]|nr:hypothetical protein [Pseudomonadales bacterium]
MSTSQPQSRKRNSGSQKIRGLAMVEFVITVPVLLLLLFATLELSRAFMQYNALTKSVRDGVRFLASNAIGGSTGVININAQTQNQVANLVVYGNSAGSGAHYYRV